MTPAARIALEIQDCENGTVEAPLWEYLLGWADWHKEKHLIEQEQKEIKDGVKIGFDVQFTEQQLSELSRQQLKALMCGVAEVLSQDHKQ